MDLVREILLKVESLQDPSSDDLLKQTLNDADRATVLEHLRLLIDEAKLITGIAVSDRYGVRDTKIWASTEHAAEHVQGFRSIPQGFS
jgi:hypothetical protein